MTTPRPQQPTRSVRLVITGRVQRVGFRRAAASQAQALRLTIRAENQADGSVEIIASGKPAAIDQLIDWAHRGPALASVASVSVTELPDPATEP